MMDSGLFRVDLDNKRLSSVEEVDLAAVGLKERYDLQEWVSQQPDVLGEQLLIINKEYDGFVKTRERVDLVALDRDGNIVIIELKRDDSGADVHWQAIKYASYFASAKAALIIELLANYRGCSLDEATRDIRQFTGIDDLANLNNKQRIILASHRFAVEATSAVLWLTKRDVDIRCVQLTPYKDAVTGALYLQSAVIIPIPGTEDYEVTAGRGSGAKPVIMTTPRGGDDVTQFLSGVADKAMENLAENLVPERRSRRAGIDGVNRYYKLWFQRSPWANHRCDFTLVLELPADGPRVLWVCFELRIGWLQEAGCTTAVVDHIHDGMEAYAKGHAVEVVNDKRFTWVGHQIPAPTLDDALHDQAAVHLRELLTELSPIVDGAVDETPSESAERAG